VHKGIDKFVKKGTPALSSKSGLVIFTGSISMGGNEAWKPTHLHYYVDSLIPYPWQYSLEIKGWKKMFFINPTENFN
jgi:hypothetical protein